MKKLVAGALALAMGFGAFAQEAGQIGSLATSAGKISFGAWGRSTFNIGNVQNTTKVEVSTKLSDKAYYNTVAGLLMSSDPTMKNLADYAAANSGLTDWTTASANPAAADAIISGLAANADIRSGIDAQVASNPAVAGLKSLEMDDTDTEWYASVAPDWSYGSRVGFWIIGRTNDERWGFDFNLDSDAAALFVGAQNYDSKSSVGALKEKSNGLSYAESGKYAVAIGDQAKIWGIFDFNPIDLKVAFGKMREQELRGSIGDFGQRESGDVKSEDDIFTEMWPVMGMFVSAKGQEGTALEGLYAAVDCDAFGLVSAKNEEKELTTKLSTLASTIQGGVGYTIPGLAQVKAQFIADSIEEGNKKYSKAKYQAARDAGFGWDDYAGSLDCDGLGGCRVL